MKALGVVFAFSYLYSSMRLQRFEFEYAWELNANKAKNVYVSNWYSVYFFALRWVLEWIPAFDLIYFEPCSTGVGCSAFFTARLNAASG
jgi:hypothetical protein